MGSFQYLAARALHVDDAGNLISCTYVDFRDPTERFPITTLKKASSKRYAIPGYETIRLSKPSCFLGQGEGLTGCGGEQRASGQSVETEAPSGASAGMMPPARQPRPRRARRRSRTWPGPTPARWSAEPTAS